MVWLICLSDVFVALEFHLNLLQEACQSGKKLIALIMPPFHQISVDSKDGTSGTRSGWNGPRISAVGIEVKFLDELMRYVQSIPGARVPQKFDPLRKALHRCAFLDLSIPGEIQKAGAHLSSALHRIVPEMRR